MAFELHIGDQVWNRDTVVNYDGPESSVHFCRDWIQGNPTFEFTSSGSTGIPKVFKMRRDQMAWSANATYRAMQITKDQKLLLSLDPNSTGGKMLLVRAMEWDCPIHQVSPKRNPIIQLKSNHDFTFVSLVPLQIQDILSEKESIEKLNRFRIILLGGAGISQPLRDQLQSLKPRIYHSFGMTETCSHIALAKVNGPNSSDRFYQLPGVLLSQDSEGRLIVDSPSAVDRPILTNDLVEFADDGSFRPVGRADNTINSGGIKIQLEVMDEMIRQLILPIYPERQHFCWFRPDSALGQKLVLILEGPEPEPEQRVEILNFLKKELPPYKAPKEIIFAPAFNYTSSGKIDKLKTWSNYGEKQA